MSLIRSAKHITFLKKNNRVPKLIKEITAEDWSILEYLAASLQKSIKKRFNYSDKAVWSKVQNCSFLLPIQTDEQNRPVKDEEKRFHPEGYIPDWQYMEDYIRAVEKVIVADVVRYKGSVIENTKKIVKEKT